MCTNISSIEILHSVQNTTIITEKRFNDFKTDDLGLRISAISNDTYTSDQPHCYGEHTLHSLHFAHNTTKSELKTNFGKTNLQNSICDELEANHKNLKKQLNLKRPRKQRRKDVVVDNVSTVLPECSRDKDNAIELVEIGVHTDYDPRVEYILYPKDLMDQVKGSDGVDVYTVQVRGNIAMCFVCYLNLKVLYGVLPKFWGNQVIDHVTGVQHKKNAKNNKILLKLRSYHAFWTSVEYELQLQQITFQPKSSQSALCTACHKSLDYIHIKAHVETSRHKQNFKLQLQKRRLEHIGCFKLKAVEKPVVQEKDTEMLKHWKDTFKSVCRVNSLSKNMINTANQFTQAMDSTYELCGTLESIISRSFKLCKIYPYGSRLSFLGHKLDTLKLFIDVDDTYMGNTNQEVTEQAYYATKVSKVLHTERDKLKCKHIKVLQEYLPFVSLTFRDTKIRYDLWFLHGGGVEHTKFIRYWIEVQPIIQSLILCLKHWVKCCKFEQELSTYAITWLAINFLQQYNYIPTVERIRKLCKGPGHIINGWETLSNDLPSVAEMKTHVVPYFGDVFSLLRDWYNYYANFDYTNYVVCPLVGYPLPKELFEASAPGDVSVTEAEKILLPPAMRQYVRRRWGSREQKFCATSAMCLQDPIYMSCNLTKDRSIEWLKMWIELCKMSYDYLNNLK